MSKTTFIAGALVGLATGLLIAPKKGEDLRDDISDSAVKWKKKLYKMANKTSNEIADLQEMLEDGVEGLSEDIRFRLLTILNEA